MIGEDVLDADHGVGSGVDVPIIGVILPNDGGTSEAERLGFVLAQQGQFQPPGTRRAPVVVDCAVEVDREGLAVDVEQEDVGSQVF